MEFVWAKAQAALLGVLRETTLADAFCTGHFPFTSSASLIAKEKPAAVLGGKTT
jgi:hypothetical protein